ncbi:MAG: peptidase T [Flavobacteriales bacterium]|nr:peptidase T [Flavobacteriaceae bacterium]PHX91844.1 MAG: peptidase T [Flavobacteriales bacterium]
MKSIETRFCEYARIDTQSDPNSPSQPSTEKQKDLSRILVNELLDMGLDDAHLDEFGYVYATLSSNATYEVPVLCFCAHVDTSPDCSGFGVKPIIHRNYQGQDLVLPDDTSQVITSKNHPYLLERIGDDIITASGTTLLGADDKAGVAVIMDFVQHMVAHPELLHGDVKILFTPDEEIGRGVDKVDIDKLGAQIGYTLDAGECGCYEDETFSADGVKINFYGISAHPGYAKNKLVNALKIAGAFLSALPTGEWSPESTSDTQGFVHPITMGGMAEHAWIQFIVRDFNTAQLTHHERRLESILEAVLAKFPGATAKMDVTEQYRNMKEMVDKDSRISDLAIKAIEKANIKPILSRARGGTDGSRLSFMGLPCPNLFTGEMAFHGKQEYVSIQDMKKSSAVLVNLSGLWALSLDKKTKPTP